MEDSKLIERRKAELEASNDRLLTDIDRCQRHIDQNNEELVELAKVLETLDRLRGARRKRTKQDDAVPPPRFEGPRAGEKMTVGSMIKEVLLRQGQPLRPPEIDRYARELFQRDFHPKQIGKECCRLFNEGALLKDDYTNEYSLPPDWGSDRPSKEGSLPHQPTAKGREAVPGGVI
ncbi:MAG: hypothetical protein WEB56_14575 [Roseovarius sp.]